MTPVPVICSLCSVAKFWTGNSVVLSKNHIKTILFSSYVHGVRDYSLRQKKTVNQLTQKMSIGYIPPDDATGRLSPHPALFAPVIRSMRPRGALALGLRVRSEKLGA